MDNQKYSNTTKKRTILFIGLMILIIILLLLFFGVKFNTHTSKVKNVQNDFRAFEMAFKAVSRAQDGFNTFGWDTGDTNQNGIRDYYYEGDINCNGMQDVGETWTDNVIYTETFTKIFSLKKNGTGSYDRDALNRLENAINSYLVPRLHITIKDDGEIVMANGAQDPWNNEYHGYYITNAEVDGKDRGAIVMYSDGANGTFGSSHRIANGVVSISIPGDDEIGKDDYGLAVIYTYAKGYGEIKTVTSGFDDVFSDSNDNDVNNSENNDDVNNSENNNDETTDDGNDNTNNNDTNIDDDYQNEPDEDNKNNDNQSNNNTNNKNDDVVDNESGDNASNEDNDNLDDNVNEDNGNKDDENIPSDDNTSNLIAGLYQTGAIQQYQLGNINTVNDMLIMSWNDLMTEGIVCVDNGIVYIECNSEREFSYIVNSLSGDLILPDDNSIRQIGDLYYDENAWNEITETWGVAYGLSAFYACCNLTGVYMPDSVTHISSSAFAACESLTTVRFSANTKIIEREAFFCCSNLKDCVLPDKLEFIGKGAFCQCTSLINIDIPNSVTTLGPSAFAQCTALKHVSISTNLLYLDVAVFSTCFSLTDVVIPDNIVSISRSAFVWCKNLINVTMPDSVTYIGYGAFDTCPKLKYNEYDNAYYLGNDNNPYVCLIKAQSEDIETCTIHPKTKLIYKNAFYSFNYLTSVTIPTGVVFIGENAFRDCKALESIIIPNSVINIESQAFRNTGIQTVTIPNSVKSIGDGAFGSCNNLTNIIVENENVFYISIDGNLYSKDQRSLIQYAAGKNEATFIIPSHVNVIEELAFDGCKILTNITFQENVNLIDSSAFYACNGLTTIRIPNNVSYIKEYAFNSCKNLDTIVFEGTKEEWNKIVDNNWYQYSSIQTIICLDGNIILEY